MIDFAFVSNAISANSLLGKAIRAPLSLVPPGLQVRIVQGPLRGFRWIIGSGTHQQWLGTFERFKQEIFCEMVGKGDTVLDIGAHVGYFTLLASRLVGEHGRVLAVEPSPRNYRYLQTHLRLNGIVNVTTIQAAVSECAGTEPFAEGECHLGGSLSEKGRTTVSVLRLDDLYESGAIESPRVIKMDIEGAEYRALLGAKKIITEHRPVIILETHGQEMREACAGLLQGFGYRLELLPTQLPEFVEMVAKPHGSAGESGLFGAGPGNKQSWCS